MNDATTTLADPATRPAEAPAQATAGVDTRPLRPVQPNATIAVNGVSHRQDAVKGVRVGDPVVLKHELTNPHDPYAVRIERLDGEVLGFVPRLNRVNERLVMHHRGGTWGGVVDEVLGGVPGRETLGLRVRIVRLLADAPDGRYGADHPGLRVSCDDATLEPDAGEQPHPDAETQAQIVRTRATGRILGELVEVVGAKIRVRTTGGSVVSYASTLVEVVPAEQPQPA